MGIKPAFIQINDAMRCRKSKLREFMNHCKALSVMRSVSMQIMTNFHQIGSSIIDGIRIQKTSTNKRTRLEIKLFSKPLAGEPPQSAKHCNPKTTDSDTLKMIHKWEKL